MENVLIGKNIWKSFENKSEKNTVLKGVDIEIQKGEFVAIMGSSGSGKSTLLYVLSSIDKADSGQIRVDDIDISRLNDDELSDMRRKRFGFVFQQPTLLKNLNILENILFPVLYEKKADKKEYTQKAKKLMEITGISGLENRGVTEVSGGQLQRAGICRAVLHTPNLLFADEPTGALDSKSGEEVIKLFRKINNMGISILLVTHDKNVAIQADRVLFMKDGEIVDKLNFDKYSFEKRIEEIEIVEKRVFR